MKPTRVFLLLALLVPRVAISAQAADPTDYSGLHAAAENGDLSKARAALQGLSASERKKAVNLADRDGRTPLDYAARHGSLEVVELYLAAGATVNRADPRTGWTPLHFAAEQRHAGVVWRLLAQQADPNAKTNGGKLPLELAWTGSTLAFGPPGDRDATLRALLEKGADPSPLVDQVDALRRGLLEREQRIQSLEHEVSRLETAYRQLNEQLDRIRNAAGNPGFRPSDK